MRRINSVAKTSSSNSWQASSINEKVLSLKPGTTIAMAQSQSSSDTQAKLLR